MEDTRRTTREAVDEVTEDADLDTEVKRDTAPTHEIIVTTTTDGRDGNRKPL